MVDGYFCYSNYRTNTGFPPPLLLLKHVDSHLKLLFTVLLILSSPCYLFSSFICKCSTASISKSSVWEGASRDEKNYAVEWSIEIAGNCIKHKKSSISYINYSFSNWSFALLFTLIITSLENKIYISIFTLVRLNLPKDEGTNLEKVQTFAP